MNTNLNLKKEVAKTQEILTKALNNFGFNVISINEVEGKEGTEFRIQLVPEQDPKLLQTLKKDIAITLNVKSLDVEVLPDFAIVKIPACK